MATADLWTFKLASAPSMEFGTTTPGLIETKRMATHKAQDYVEVAIGADCPHIPSESMRDRTITVPILDGPDRTFSRKRESMRVRVSIDDWTGAQLQAFDRMLASGRLVAFSPNYDAHTFFASSFGAKETDGGIAEVGDNLAASYLGRVVADVYPGYFLENDGLIKTPDTASAKLTRGYMGRAILLERGNLNLVTDADNWTAVSGAILMAGDAANDPITNGKQFFINAGGTQRIDNTSVAAATVAQVYTAWALVKGTGKCALAAVHNSGATVATGTAVILSDSFQVLRVTWSQVGTTISLRIVNSGTFGAMGHVTTTQVNQGEWPIGSSLPESQALTNADELKITGGLMGAQGLTFALWFKKPLDSSSLTKHYFVSFSQTGSHEGYIYYRSDTQNFHAKLCHGSTESVGASVATAGDWVQLVLTIEESSGSILIRMYENAVEIDTQTITPTHVIRPANVYIGSARGLTTPAQDGCDTPLDSARIDCRTWTAQNVQDDYDMRNDDGVRAFLMKTSGRLFRITGIPKGFNGPFTDQIKGDVILEEASVNVAGVQ